MDIADIKPSARKVELKKPNGEGVGLVFHIVSKYDPAVEAVQRKITNRRLNSRDEKYTAEALKADARAIVCASVTGWDWKDGASFGGEQLEFTQENLEKVVRAQWIYDFLDRETGATADFFEG